MISRTRVKTLFRFSLRMMLIAFTRDPKMRSSSTLQDEVEHIAGWMAMNKLSQNIPKTELVHFLNCKDESIVLKNTEITCTENVKYLGISLDKNLTYGFHVKRVLNKLAKHVSIINRLRHFTSSLVVIQYYKTYM